MAEVSDHRTFCHISPRDRRPSSRLTLAAIMLAIAGFFVATIASVFIYSHGSSLTQTAQIPQPAPAVYRLMETTGSGG